jgi:NADH-quinone oxidoreductase subunit N
MFLCVGVMYDRVHSREISAYGGVVNTMPKFAAFMVLFALANAGLPGTSGFVGEFLVILASFKANVWYAFFAGTTLVLGAAYTLWMVKRVIFGEIANDHVRELTDLNGREFLVLGVLAIAVLLVGLWRSRSWFRRSSLKPVESAMNGFNVAEFNAGLHYASPEIFLGLAACAILMLDLLLSDAQRSWTGVLSVLALLTAAVLSAVEPVGQRIVALGGLYELDRMAQVLKVVTLLSVAVVFVYSTDYLKRRAMLKGEYYVLGLFATLGAMALISAGSLITLYLGLELMSLCLYAMVAFDRDSGIAAESAIKYFVLGSMASGTLLYGMSIVYGVTGYLELASIALVARSGYGANIGLLFGIAFIIVGIGFKLGAVPFHMWIPDVYEGSPTCVTVFIGTASKLAAFALAMRLLPEALGASQPDWSQMLVVLAVLSMGIGTVIAIAQTNLKRMLAYSTISHIGYILLGILAGTPQGYQAAMFYMISYVLVTSGAFGMILLLARQGFEADKLVDFRGLNARSPWFAGMMAILMFSLAGVPPFIGFWAKLGVIQAVLGVSYTWLAVVAVLFSVVAAFFYLRVVKLMYFDDPTDRAPIGGSTLMRAVLSLNALAAFALGVVPGSLIALCQRALP